LDGLYSWSEYILLKQRFPDMIVVSVVTDAKIRKERLKNRPVRPLTAEQVDSRDIAEIEQLEKGGPIAIADYFILNNGSWDELKKQYIKIKESF
jgi:dephospho-CoA kinase